MKQTFDKTDETGKAIKKLNAWAGLAVLSFLVGCVAWLAGFPTIAGFALIAMFVSAVIAYVYSDVAIFKGKGGMPIDGI